MRSAGYTANAVNQYTSRTVPGGFDVLGIADAPATVLVNGSSSGVYERGQYFRKEVSVSNGSAPVWQSVAVTTSTGGTGNPALDVKFLYDGWNAIAELDASNALLRNYAWRLDLSGNERGAVESAVCSG